MLLLKGRMCDSLKSSWQIVRGSYYCFGRSWRFVRHNVLISLFWEFMDVVSHKQDRGCLLKLDVSYQVYENIVLLFWCSGKFSRSLYYKDWINVCSWLIVFLQYHPNGMRWVWPEELEEADWLCHVDNIHQEVWMLCFKKKIFEMFLLLHVFVI